MGSSTVDAGQYPFLAGKGRTAWRARDIKTPRILARQVYPSSTGSTVTFQSGGSSLITNGDITAYRDVVAQGAVSVFDGCNLIHPSALYPSTISYKAICRQQDINGSYAKSFSISFFSDADKVEIVYINRGGTTYRLWVDDQALGSLTPVTKPTTGSFESVLIDFSSQGGAKPRRYRVDLSGADFGGIILSGSVYSVWASDQRGPTVFCMADSLFGGSGMSTSSNAQIPNYLGNLFGWDNVWNLGIGGTGYIATNAPNSFNNNALSQLQYLAPSNAAPTTTTPGNTVPIPDILIAAFGHNDGVTAATVTAANTFFQTARMQWPNTYIVAMGPLGNGLNGTSYNAIETSIFAAVSSYVDATISIWQGTNRPWMFGTGTVSATTGTSNGDLYIGSDGVHWTDAGISYISERLAPEIIKVLSA